MMTLTVAMTIVVALASSAACAPVPMPEYLDNLKDLRDYANTQRNCIDSFECRVKFESGKRPILYRNVDEIESLVEAEKTSEALVAAERLIRRSNSVIEELEGEKSGSDAVLRLQAKNNLSYGLYNRARALCQQDRYIEALLDLKRIKLLRRKAPGVEIQNVLKFELQIYDQIEKSIKEDVRDLFITTTDNVNESHDTLTKLFEPLSAANWGDELSSLLIVHKILEDAHIHYNAKP